MHATGATTFIGAVHWWNARLCPPIGVLSNLLLILLVLTRTPKEMRLHSRILLQTGILDILLLLLTTLGQTAFSYQQNTMLLIFEGYFLDFFTFDFPLRVFYFIWSAYSTFTIYGLTAQFVYRYLVLNRGVKINLCQYLQALLALFSVAASFHIMLYFQQKATDQRSSNDIENIGDQLILQFYKSGSAKFLAILFEENWHAGIYVTFSIICFGVIAFCGWKISRYVNSQLIGQKKKLSKQLNRTLIILAILPFAQLTMSSFILIGNAFSKFGQGANEEENITLRMAELCMSLSIHWLPVLNPLVGILTNTPYRRAVCQAMTSRIGPTHPITN